MAIQDDNTIVTKGDLKALYTDKIAPYLGANVMMSTNVSDYYSTDEKVVGVWTDGKPIYQKTYIKTSGVNGNGWNAVPHGISGGIETLVAGWGTYKLTTSIPSEWSNANGYFNGRGCLVDCAHKDGGDTEIGIFGENGNAINNAIWTIQYTKPGDAAGSGVTTPGAYDINRPDLWPNGQEIFFGNGLYGMRKAETAAANNLQSGIVLVSNVSKTACCYNKGGMIDMSGTNGTNWYDINGGWDYKGNQRQFNPLITNTDQTFRFYCQDNQGYTTQNIQYNIWFTYTK